LEHIYEFHHFSHGQFLGCVGAGVHEKGKGNAYSEHGPFSHVLSLESVFGSYHEEGGTSMSSLQLIVEKNQSRQPCGDEHGRCGVMVG
jgi:hypothetical protein